MFRKDFLTKRCILQYIGFISERLHNVKGRIKPYISKDGMTTEGIPSDAESRISKYFYHAFHKIFELKRIVHYKDPIVTFSNGSEEREFIIGIRKTRPLTGELDPLILLKKAKCMLKEIKQDWEDVDKTRKDHGQALRRDEVDISKLMEILKTIRLQYITESNLKYAIDDGSIDEKSIKVDLDAREKQQQQQQNNGEDSELSFYPPNADTRAVIMKRLHEIEKTFEIKIIFAAELSSRSLGTAHLDSDHDLYCVFVHKCDKYFSMKSFSKNFRMTYSKDVTNRIPEIDIVGQECSHCVQMMSSSNLTMFELFFSPIVYLKFETSDFDWVQFVRDTMEVRYKRRSVLWSCISHAKQNYSQYISRRENDNVLGKKYLHVIRRILMALWIIKKETDGVNNADDGMLGTGRWPFPYSIQMQLECIDIEILPQEVRDKLVEMLADTDNRESKLGLRTVKIPILDSFIQRSIDRLSDHMKNSVPGEKKKHVNGLPGLVRQQSDATVWDEISCKLIREVSTSF